MVNLAALIIFLTSLFGIGFILIQKIPSLMHLPREIKTPKQGLFSRLKNKIKGFGPFKSSSPELFLHKFLSKMRILTLKIEQRVSVWQAQLRERLKKKKEAEKDTYWEELKKSTNQEGKTE